MKRTTIGLDIAKRVFQAHSVDPESGEVTRTKLHRAEVLRHPLKDCAIKLSGRAPVPMLVQASGRRKG